VLILPEENFRFHRGQGRNCPFQRLSERNQFWEESPKTNVMGHLRDTILSKDTIERHLRDTIERKTLFCCLLVFVVEVGEILYVRECKNAYKRSK
jgi:hypothetical protein